MIFFIAFLIINLFFLWKVERTVFSPAGIFTSIWLMTTLFYNSGYLGFYEPTQKLVNTLFLIFSSFYIGYYFLIFRYKNQIRNNNASFLNIKCNYKSLNLVTIFLLSLLSIRVVTVFYDLYSIYGSIPNILSNGDIIYAKLRTNELSVGIPTFIPADQLTCFFIGFRYLITRRIDRIFILGIVQSIFIALLLSQRLSLCLSIVALITPIASFARDIKIFTIPRLLVFLSFFFVSSTFRGLDMTYMVNTSNNLFMPLIAQLSSIGFYLAGPLAGLNEYIANGVDEYGFLFSMDGILKNIGFFLNIEGLDSGSYSTVIYRTPFPTVVYTAFKFLIDDFGNFLYPLTVAVGSISVLLQRYNGSFLAFKCLALTVINTTLFISFFAYSLQLGGFIMFIISCAFFITIAIR